jgi:hypothetical protein
VQEKIAQVNDLATEIDLTDAVCVLQLYDNNVYLVGGPGGVRHLPVRDSAGRYHVDGRLLVADKAGIKDLTATLAPLIQELGGSKKLFLTPLARYWLSTCCEDTDHVSNYREKNYLPKLNMAISSLRDYTSGTPSTLAASRITGFCVPIKWLGWGPDRPRSVTLKQRNLQSFGGTTRFIRPQLPIVRWPTTWLLT